MAADPAAEWLAPISVPAGAGGAAVDVDSVTGDAVASLLSVVSVNVLTLSPKDGIHGPSVRRATLEQQFHDERFDIIGMQETKARDSLTLSGDFYDMVGAAAGQSSHGGTICGCALWLHRQLRVDLNHVAVLHLGHDLIVVRFPLDGFKYRCWWDTLPLPCSRRWTSRLGGSERLP